MRMSLRFAQRCNPSYADGFQSSVAEAQISPRGWPPKWTPPAKCVSQKKGATAEAVAPGVLTRVADQLAAVARLRQL